MTPVTLEGSPKTDSSEKRGRFPEVALLGTGQSRYVRRPEPHQTTAFFMREALLAALVDCNLRLSDIDGLAVATMSLAPDTAVDLAWRLGLSLRWVHQDTAGGSSSLNAMMHALSAVQLGLAETVVVLAGDATGLAGYAKIAANFNSAIRDHAAPLGYGGPNTAFAMLTQRQMKRFGLEKTDYGEIAIAQRAWAALNPFAVYRAPLTMDEYLSSAMVASPLNRYDCVPVVAGGQAIIVSRPDRVPAGRPPILVRAIRISINQDNQEGDGLETGHAAFASELWDEAGASPEDVDVVSLYDDYPAMVLAQANDLGLVAAGDLKRFVHNAIKNRIKPINTWGGMMSAGQPGGPAGGLNGMAESVLQLQGRAAARQVSGARLALSTCYGMTLYRYGATAGAIIMERG